MAVTARIRFGALPSSRVPRVLRDAALSVWCDFTDTESGAAVDVSSVTAVAYIPGGAVLSPAPTVTEEAAGEWRADLTPIYAGEWRIVISCASPSVAADGRAFIVEASEPDATTRPDPTYWELETLRDQAQASQAAAETSADRAEAAQEAAESAASSSLGPMTVTSVGGTLDGSGNCLTYTGVLPAVPQLGSEAEIIFHAPNAAAPRLRPTVGGVLQAQVSIRDAFGNALGAQVVQAGEKRRLWFDGTYWRIDYNPAPREVKTTSWSWIYASPGDASGFGRVRFRAFDDGDFLFDSGDGTSGTGWTSRFGFFDGAFRIYDPNVYVGETALGEAGRVLTDHRPPLIAATVKHLVGAPARANERTSPQRFVIPYNEASPAPGYYQLTGLDTADKRFIIVPQAATGTWIDCVNMPKGAEAVVICLGTAVAHLYTGEGEWVGNGVDAATLTAYSWLNTGGKLLTTSAGAWVRIIRENTSFLAVPQTGSVSAASGSVVMPEHDVITADGPQSWGVSLGENRAAGAVPRMVALGLGYRHYSLPAVAVGASALPYSAENATLFYWDQRTDTPGRRLRDMVAAIKADRVARERLMGLTPTAGGTNAPAVQAIYWTEGLNVMEFWGPSTTHPQNCPQVYTSSFVKMAQWVEGELGHSVIWMVHPLTSQDFGTFGTTDDAGTAANETAAWHAVRMAQLRLPAAGAAATPSAVNIIIAPEIYGEPRSVGEPGKRNDRHYDFRSYAAIGDRDMQALANALTAGDATPQTNHVGPFIPATGGVVSADSGAGLRWDIVIDYGTGSAAEIQATRPEAILRLLPAATGNIDTDDWATPLTIVGTRWVAGTGTTIKLRCLLSAPYLGGTPRPAVLWGAAADTDDLGCLIRTVDPNSAVRFYLRQFLSGG